jgi:hypothetical protein
VDPVPLLYDSAPSALSQMFEYAHAGGRIHGADKGRSFGEAINCFTGLEGGEGFLAADGGHVAVLGGSNVDEVCNGRVKRRDAVLIIGVTVAQVQAPRQVTWLNSVRLIGR